MGLKLLRSTKEHKLSPKAEKLLISYMDGAIKEIGFVSKGKANSSAEWFAEDFYYSGKAKGLSTDDVTAMEKRVDKSLKKYGFKERLNYLTNVRAIEENPTAFILKGGAAGMLAMGAFSEALAGNNHGAALAVLGIAVAASLGKVAANQALSGKTDEENRKIDEYTNMKHAQLALKQLKRKMEFPEDRTVVADKVQAALLKKQAAVGR